MAYGDGSKPYKRADGYWVASFEAGFTERGTRRRKTVAAKTEAECKRRLRDALREFRADMETLNLDPRMTVKRWTDQWLEDYRLTAKPRTWATDRGMVAKWLWPTIGNRRLAELSAADMRRVSAAVLAAGRSQTTALNVARLLRRILKAAVVAGYKVPASALNAPLPVAAASSRDALPLESASRILQVAADRAAWPDLDPLPTGRAAHGMDTDWRDHSARRAYRVARETDASRWLAALLQGMRQGEALGLEWERVDLDRGVMDVSWQLQRLPKGATIPAQHEARRLHENYWLTRPKSEAGRRMVPITPLMEAALRDWRERCPTPDGLVWPRATGTPMSPSEDRAAWGVLLDRAGVTKPGGGRYVLHEARHTTVSLLLAAGIPPEVIVRIVGHSTFASTAHYAHLDLAASRAALEKVAMALAGTPALPQ